MNGLYPWIKALHVISMVAWMAGMFYLPRLFVYHSRVAQDSEANAIFKVMELKLMKIIMAPAAIATWSFGVLMLILNPTLLDQRWLWVKLAAVVVMTGLHHAMIGWRRAFAEDRNKRSERYFRLANEVPTLALIVIVIMVVVRPF